MAYLYYSILQSTTYYRILNGSTANSTEVNVMPVPTMNIIESMGKN